MMRRFVQSILLCLILLKEAVGEEEVEEMDNNTTISTIWKFGMASGGSSFFDPIREGFLETCDLLSSNETKVECEYFAENRSFFAQNYNESEELSHCVPQIRNMTLQGFDGISLYCGVDHPVLQQARDGGIVLSSFDIKPSGIEMPYVGTDNDNIGESMARLLRLLKQIPPGETGTYFCFSFRRIPARYQRFVAEIEKDNERSDRGHWKMVTTNVSGRPEGDNLEIGEEIFTANQSATLDRLVELNPDAIIFMNQSPLRREGYVEWVQRNRWRNITLVGLQGDDRELQTLARRNVDGLIGQVAFDIGRLSAQTLYDLKSNKKVPAELFTKLINYNLVPERLPDANVNENLLGNLKIVGYTFFGVVAFFAVACLGWTFKNRKGTMVRSSQPIFLAMTATGMLVMASAMIPLSMDAGDDEGYSETWAQAVCMSPVWLVVMGFSITFSALFAKTWRVNRFFNSSSRFERVRVQEKDVLAPFIVVVSLNIVVLSVWTAVDPLMYTREFEDGLDLYNREIASNGYCRSDHAEYFLLPLGIINLILVMLACWQAYRARNIKSEFAEASYIGLAVFSFLQAFITGIPVIAVVRDGPQAFYLVLTCIIFVLSMVILGLIFLPKIRMEQKYKNMSPGERRRSLAVSVRSSMKTMSSTTAHSDQQPGSGRSYQHGVTFADAAAAATNADEPADTVQPTVNEKIDDEPIDSTSRKADEYGSLVERVDDVLEDKISTYASEKLEAELKVRDEKLKRQNSTNSTEETS